MRFTITSLPTMGAIARGRRLDLGLSQAEVADSAQVSRAWLNSFEAGQRNATSELVLRLFDALGLDLVVETRDHAEPAPRGAGGDGIDLDALLDDYRSS